MPNIQKPFLFSDVKAPSLEVITGPMFSGKTTTLIDRVNTYQKEGLKVLCLKPAIDQRYSESEIVTHNKEAVEAKVVTSKEDLEVIKDSLPDVLAIDEIQFFGEYIIDFTTELLQQGVRVVVTGLNKDYQTKEFERTSQFMEKADHVEMLHGECHQCGDRSIYTYRKSSSGGQVLVGGHDLYESRCHSCYHLENK